MQRLVMGNIMSPNISGISVKETANLKNLPERFPVAHKALTEDTYVDNVLIVKPNISQKNDAIKEIEYVARKGGFKFKPWVRSGENVSPQEIQLNLPNAIGADEEKALGIGWDVRNDLFFVKPDMMVGGKKTRK